MHIWQREWIIFSLSFSLSLSLSLCMCVFVCWDKEWKFRIPFGQTRAECPLIFCSPAPSVFLLCLFMPMSLLLLALVSLDERSVWWWIFNMAASLGNTFKPQTHTALFSETKIAWKDDVSTVCVCLSSLRIVVARARRGGEGVHSETSQAQWCFELMANISMLTWGIMFTMFTIWV